ncbi:MAG: hypothetical protein R3261_08595, partial [Alphaproteobacteria bacterium]|nr:hypothetical protein [Alphaproteobacteria bacterium]
MRAVPETLERIGSGLMEEGDILDFVEDVEYLVPKPHPQEELRLRELKKTNLLDSDQTASLDRLTKLVSLTLNVPTVLISLVDKDRQ